MGWEQRGGATYYYSAERVGGRVVKCYFGGGLVGALAAQLDAQRQNERDESAAVAQRVRSELADLDSMLAPLHDLAAAAAAAALVAAGCHRSNRGPWRKRRAKAR